MEVVEPLKTREAVHKAQVRSKSVGQSGFEIVTSPTTSGVGASRESRPETPGPSDGSVLAENRYGPVLVTTRTPQLVGPLEERCINFRSLNRWFSSGEGGKTDPLLECFKSFYLPQDNDHFNNRTMD